MSDTLDYGNLMHDAMRRLIQKVLEDVAANGLPGEHHFFITFDTLHHDVNIADWLTDRYPEEMTIVVQHWFDNLVVTDAGFSITLNFGDNPEPLYIPFDALKTFVDPSVEFGLRFETQDGEDEGPVGVPPVKEVRSVSPPVKKPKKTPPPDKASTDADVVSLDSFRK
jgi:hypothetical protein